MANVRSKRLFGPITVPGTQQLVYTCPAGETALLKTLTVANNFGVAQSCSLRLNINSGAGHIWRAAVPGSTAVVLTGWFVVLHPGDTLFAECSQASAIFSGFGAELEGVAD